MEFFLIKKIFLTKFIEWVLYRLSNFVGFYKWVENLQSFKKVPTQATS